MPRKTSKNTSKLSAQWEHEYSLLKRRAKYWEKTKHILVDTDIEKPKRVTQKSINKIKNIRLSNMTEKETRKYQEAYQEKYDNSDTSNEKPYIPPTEYDYMNDPDWVASQWWEDTPNEPIDIRQEYDAWINDLIDSILTIADNSSPRVNEDLRSIFKGLLEDSRQAMGDKAFYEYLSNSDVISRLQSIAYEGMSTSPTPANQHIIDGAIVDFAVTLNMGRPLSDEQAYTLQLNSAVDFDYDDYIED